MADDIFSDSNGSSESNGSSDSTADESGESFPNPSRREVFFFADWMQKKTGVGSGRRSSFLQLQHMKWWGNSKAKESVITIVLNSS